MLNPFNYFNQTGTQGQTFNASPENQSLTVSYGQFNLNPAVVAPSGQGSSGPAGSSSTIGSGNSGGFNFNDFFNGIVDFLSNLFSPVVLDLAGNGIKITPLDSSTTFQDTTGDGYKSQTAWAGAGNAVLFVDPNNAGTINQANQYIFTNWDPTATSDMQALLDVFDTNHNGSLDAGDAAFSQFKLMVTNPDGTQSVETLAQAGVTSIALNVNAQTQSFSDGSAIGGETTYTKAGGGTGTVATVSFASAGDENAVQATTTHNGDGSATIDTKALNADGSLAREIIATTSADGLTKTIRFDNDGDGQIDTIQTDNIAGPIETLTDSTVAGVMLDQTVTITSVVSGVTTVTILRDTTGGVANGADVIAQKEVDTTSGGLTTQTIWNLEPNGAVQNETVTTPSAGGMSTTTKQDLNGDGTFDLTTVNAISSTAFDDTLTWRTTTTTDTNTDGSLRDQTIVYVSTDGSRRVSEYDVDGKGGIDTYVNSFIAHNTTSSVVPGVMGTTTKVWTLDAAGTGNNGANGSLINDTVTFISNDSLTKVVQTDANGAGSGSAPIFNLTTADVTTIDPTTGARTETVTETNSNGSLRDQTVTIKAADGITRTTQSDTTGMRNANGASIFDQVETVAVAANGSTVDTATVYSPDGTVQIRQDVTTTSAGGLVQTVTSNKDGKINLTTTSSTLVSGGGSTLTVTDRSGDGTLLDTTTTTTSANGLVVTTQSNVGGDPVTTTDTTVVNADTSRTETVRTTSADGTLQSNVVTTTSANGETKTITSDLDGDCVVDQVETITQANGSTTDDIAVDLPNGAAAAETITVTKNLSTTITSLINGAAAVVTADNIVLNANGSRTETVTKTTSANVQLSKTITTTSANGLSVTTQQVMGGDSGVNETTTDATVINADDSRTETVQATAGTTLFSSKTVTTSNTGYSKTTVTGSTKTTDVTALNSDGSTTETTTDTNNDGTQRDQTVVTTSANGLALTTARNLGGSVSSTETVATQANGTIVDTDVATNASGAVTWKSVKTSAANGLSWASTLDTNGDGVIDENQSDTKALNADGSTTETQTDANTSGNINPGRIGDNDTVVTTISANGLTKNINVTGSNEQTNLGHATTDKTVVNADGSSTETTTIMNASGSAVLDSEIDAVAAHGLSHSIQIDVDGNGSYDVTDRVVTNSDGSTTETQTQTSFATGALIEKTVTSTSANGLVVNLQRDTDGDGNFDHFETKTQNADQSSVDVLWSTTNGGVLLSKVTTTTSADGHTTTTQLDSDGDGTIDQTATSVTTTNADGSTTVTNSGTNWNGTPSFKTATTTSASGLSIQANVDLNGDGVQDETVATTITLNADGSRTKTTQTNDWDTGSSATVAAIGSLASKIVTTTSANGLSATTTEDLNGDGKTDISEVDNTLSSGIKTSTISDFNASGTLIARQVTTTSADGRLETIALDSNGDGTVDSTTTVSHVAFDNGSYDVAVVKGGTVVADTNHNIDENGVDRISWTLGGTSSSTIMTTAQEAEGLAKADRLYDTVFDRDPTVAESESWYQYSTPQAQAAAMVGSTEFSQRYGSLTNAEFVGQIYQNAYGRGPQLWELGGWLNQLAAGTATRASLVVTISESAEHLADGDSHAFTNNSQNLTGTYSAEHTADKMIAAHQTDPINLAVRGYYDTTSGTPVIGVSAASDLAGTQTLTQLAASLASSYSSESNTQFVAQIYQNGLRRAPTSQESTTWAQMLTNSTLSRADLVVALAESPDDAAATNLSRMVQGMAANYIRHLSAVQTQQLGAQLPSIAASQQQQLAVAHPHN